MDFLNKHPMEENKLDEQEVLTNLDIDADVTADTGEENNYDNDSDLEVLKNRLQKAEEDYHNQKIRAEKAEAKLKNGNSTGRVETSKYGELSALDIIAVTKANLDEDSLKEVMDYAKFKKISVSEAIKAPAVKAIISNLEENKRTAEATNTGYARRGTSKLSDDLLLRNSQKGILPDSDEDMERLIRLRRGR